jgi:hypothetical protein
MSSNYITHPSMPTQVLDAQLLRTIPRVGEAGEILEIQVLDEPDADLYCPDCPTVGSRLYFNGVALCKEHDVITPA